MAMTAPRRRWSFSLRTLFVVVLVGAAPLGWIAWNWCAVRARRAELDALAESRIEGYWVDPCPWNWWPENITPIRRQFGDCVVIALDLRESKIARDRLESIRGLFPEARITTGDGVSEPQIELRFWVEGVWCIDRDGQWVPVSASR